MLRHGSRHSARVALNGAPIGLAFSGISYLLARWQFRAWLELFGAPQLRRDPSLVNLSRLRGQHGSLLVNQRNDLPAIDPPGCPGARSAGGHWALGSHDCHERVPPQWEEGNGAFQFTGAFASDTLAGSVITPDGDQLAWSAHRAPSLERRGPVQWGRAVKLFNGTDLAGWHAVGGTN